MSSPSSNAPPSPPLLDLNKPVQVEVFFPVDNNGVPIQINPDEFLEDDLMDEDELREQAALMDQDDQHFGIEEDILEAMNDNNQHDPAPHDQQLHLGFVELVEPSIDPIFEQFPPPKLYLLIYLGFGQSTSTQLAAQMQLMFPQIGHLSSQQLY